jgi:hypothetical protein
MLHIPTLRLFAAMYFAATNKIAKKQDPPQGGHLVDVQQIYITSSATCHIGRVRFENPV